MCVQAFDEQPHLQLLKEMLTHAFATPKRHPKSKPFLDHVINFSVAEGRIWLRNYQVRWGTGSHEYMLEALCICPHHHI